MEKNTLPMLLGAFVALIIGISLIGVIASEGNAVTDTIVITDETVDFTRAVAATSGAIDTADTFNITNFPTGWKTADCAISGLDLYNASDSLVLTTDYTFVASTGVISFENTDNMNGSDSDKGEVNTTLATYEYCGDNYLAQGWGRTVIDLVPGFFALALMAIGIGLFYGVMKQEGILGI